MQSSGSTFVGRSSSMPINFDYSQQVPDDAKGINKSRSTVMASQPNTVAALSAAVADPRLAHKLNSSALIKTVKSNHMMIPLWLVCFLGIGMLYHYLSDGDYSFLMTASACIGTLSFLVVVMKIISTGSMAGLSLNMMFCYALLSTARLFAVTLHDDYLPFDKSGDFAYRVAEILNCVLAWFIIFLAFSVRKFSDTVSKEEDVVKSPYLVVGAAAIACFFHPGLTGVFLADFSWAFALYLECVAVMPQLFLFMRQKKVDATISHFMGAQALGRLLSFIFWCWTWHELNDSQSPFLPKVYVGHMVLLMQGVQLLLMGDFVFLYVRALFRSQRLENMLISAI